jgi:hypothetical protein
VSGARLRRVLAFGGAAPVVIALAACTVGTGSGQVEGNLFVSACKDSLKSDTNPKGNYGQSPAAPRAYVMNPRFFAGEPIEDIKKDRRDNRLIIRLQTSGKRVEVNDLLVFDVVSTFKVAQCVRGKIPAAALPEYAAFCWRGPAGEGPARIRIGPDRPIRANFAPRTTCQVDTFESGVVAAALDDPDDAAAGPTPPEKWRSWIEISEFGSAVTVDDLKTDFKVDFGERLRSMAFHLELMDEEVIEAVKAGSQRTVDPGITGTLTGSFDFDLERGQGAQTFP